MPRILEPTKWGFLVAFAAMVVTAVVAVGPGDQAVAGDARLGSIAITGAWARATPAAAQAGGAFVTIVNEGKADDQLVSASSDVARQVQLHSHVMEGDIMRMREVAAIPIPAGQTVALAPGGLHIMLIGLVHPLLQGSSFPLTLVFKQAGAVTVTVDVGSIGAAGPVGAMPMPDHDHMHM